MTEKEKETLSDTPEQYIWTGELKGKPFTLTEEELAWVESLQARRRQASGLSESQSEG